MGMEYYANVAETVEQDFVEKTCPKEFETFIDALDQDNEVTLESFADRADTDDNEKNTEFFKEYEALQKAFKKKIGLDLYVGYHDRQEDGDGDIDGVYWYLDFNDVYEMTPAAKKIADKISRQSYVTCG
jgi:hypothetical protein